MNKRLTCSNIRIRTSIDARTVFHAVSLNILPMITRRLDADERSRIESGNVYVWEERGAQAESTGTGIERWTDGIRWGPSRVRDGFLFYHQKQDENVLYSANVFRSSSESRTDSARTILTKQTYTVNVNLHGAIRKWHLIAYFTEATLDHLKTIDDIPTLANLEVPHEKYQTARAVKGRPEHIFNPASGTSAYSRLEYVQYQPCPPSPTIPTSPPSGSSNHMPKPSFQRRVSSPLSSTLRYSHYSSPQIPPLKYSGESQGTRRTPEDEWMLRKLTSA